MAGQLETAAISFPWPGSLKRQRFPIYWEQRTALFISSPACIDRAHQLVDEPARARFLYRCQYARVVPTTCRPAGRYAYVCCEQTSRVVASPSPCRRRRVVASASPRRHCHVAIAASPSPRRRRRVVIAASPSPRRHRRCRRVVASSRRERVSTEGDGVAIAEPAARKRKHNE